MDSISNELYAVTGTSYVCSSHNSYPNVRCILCLTLLYLISTMVAPGYAGLLKEPRTPDPALCMFYPGLLNVHRGRGCSNSTSEDSMVDTSGISVGRLAIVGGALLGTMVAIHIAQQNSWWKDNRTSFHFEEDFTYALNVDKLGHFYGAHVLAYSISSSLKWANVSDVPALWLGSGGALLFQTYVEIEDGFATWGFDRVDFAADVAGAAWPLARHYLPALQTIDLKVSYHPSPILGKSGGVGFRGQHHLVLDDYEGQTYWLSVKVSSLLPESLDEFWPDFLGIAVGYGAREIAGPSPYRVYFASFDLDMTKVIPQTSGFLRTFSEVLNFIHMPLPAIQFSPNTIWYGLYF